MWQALSYCLIISSCLNSSKWILFSATRQYLRRDDALRLRKVGSCAWGCFLKMLQVPLGAWDWLGPAVPFREATLDPDQVLCVFSLCLFSLGYLVTFYCAHSVIRKSRAGVYGGPHGANSQTSVPERQPPRFSCWSTQRGFHRIVSNWATKVMLTGWFCVTFTHFGHRRTEVFFASSLPVILDLACV